MLAAHFHKAKIAHGIRNSQTWKASPDGPQQRLYARANKPGDGPRPNGRNRYTPKTPETGRRTPRKRRRDGDTNQRRKQFCKSIPPMYAPGESNAKKSPIAPYCTRGLTNAEFNDYIALDQSRTTRALSSSATRCDGLTLSSGVCDPSAYQWIFPSGMQNGPAPRRRVPDQPLLQGSLAAPPPAALRFMTTGYH